MGIVSTGVVRREVNEVPTCLSYITRVFLAARSSHSILDSSVDLRICEKFRVP